MISYHISQSARSRIALYFKVLFVPTIVFIFVSGDASAQVAITAGAQSVYDDNIYLENGTKRPAPFVVNNAIEQDLEDGDLSTLLTRRNDGEENDDFLTNVYLGASSPLYGIEKYADGSVDGKIGGVFFNDNTEENRLTLDGTLDLQASKLVLPSMYYAKLRAALRSGSGDISVAEGSTTRFTQSLFTTGQLGYDDEVLQNTNLQIGYTGSYRAYLGEFKFSDTDDAIAEDKGSDYHSHTGSLSIDYAVTPKLTLGINGDVGVQLYTKVRTDVLDEEAFDQEDPDKTKTNAYASLDYLLDERTTFRATVGWGQDTLHNSPEPRTVTYVDENGEVQSGVVEQSKKEDTFTYSANLNYIPLSRTVIDLGADQSLTSDYQGQRIINRNFYLNASTGLTDRLVFTGGAAFIQYSPGNSLTDSTDRIELSASMTYSLTNSTSLVIGYNYADQNADDSALEANHLFNSRDYTVNRMFVAIDVGMVGLPL